MTGNVRMGHDGGWIRSVPGPQGPQVTDQRQVMLEDCQVIEEAVARLRVWAGPPPMSGMVWMSQNDPLWAKEVYAGGATFARLGSLVCCVAMVASQVYPEITPLVVADKLRGVSAFEGALLSRPARIPTAFPFLWWGGEVHWRSILADLGRLGAEVARWGPTIIEVVWDPRDMRPPQQGNQHFVVAIELTVNPVDVVVVDPFDGQVKGLVGSRYAAGRQWPAERAVFGMRLLRVVDGATSVVKRNDG